MTYKEFREYLSEFEEKVIVQGLLCGHLGEVKLVPVRNGRFSQSRFARLLGKAIYTDESVVIDYYGYLKKSYGFYIAAQEEVNELKGRQVRLINVPVIHFARIRIEDVAELSPKLVIEFPKFKKHILEAKKFPKRILNND